MKDRHVEFRSNLHVAESDPVRGQGLRHIPTVQDVAHRGTEQLQGCCLVKQLKDARLPCATRQLHTEDRIRQLRSWTLILTLLGSSGSAMFIFCHLLFKISKNLRRKRPPSPHFIWPHCDSNSREPVSTKEGCFSLALQTTSLSSE